MKGFIEVSTKRNDNNSIESPTLINVSTISAIINNVKDNEVFIAYDTGGGYKTSESYNTVIKKLEDAMA